MFIDDDMVFQHDAIRRLLLHDKAIVGALCFGRTDEMIKPIAKRLNGNTLEEITWDEIKNWDKVTKVDATGTGFLLIKREVLEAMSPPHFYFARTEEFGLTPLPMAHQDLSEDTTFMLNASKKGYSIWIDPTIIIGHHGGKVYKRPEEVVEGSIAILIPTMGRFNKLKPLVKNIEETTNVKHHIYFATDETKAINLLKKSKATVFETDKETVSYAKRINMMFRKTKEDFVFTASNDIVFEKGWDTELLKKMSIPGAGVVASNDLFNPNGTNFLVSRSYINSVGGTFDDEVGVVFHEYIHNFCDTELVTKAKIRSAYQFADLSIVEHNHPLAKKAEDDWVYKKGQESFEKDRDTFNRRVDKYARQ